MRDLIVDFVVFPPNSIDVSLALDQRCQSLEKRRPDFVYASQERNVAIRIEIDEKCHPTYPSSCEIAKVTQQSEAIQTCDGLSNISVITLRVNPDAYDVGRVSLEMRPKAVANRTKEIIDLYRGRVEREGYQRVDYFLLPQECPVPRRCSRRSNRCCGVPAQSKTGLRKTWSSSNDIKSVIGVFNSYKIKYASIRPCTISNFCVFLKKTRLDEKESRPIRHDDNRRLWRGNVELCLCLCLIVNYGNILCRFLKTSILRNAQLGMKSCPAMFPQSIVSVKYKGNRDDSERFSELLSPCSIINGTIEDGIDSWKGQLMLGSPIRSGKCRLFFFNFPGGVEETEKGFVFKIFGFVQRYLPWLMHLSNHSFVDGDAVFLHRLEENLRNRESPWDALNHYYVLTSADLMLLGFRNWLKKNARNGPRLDKGLRNGQLPEAGRRELLDWCYTHTIECQDCQNGRKLIQRIIWSCGFLAGMCLVYLGVVLSKISALKFDLKIAGCVLMLSLCLYVCSHLQRNVIPQFEFVDYVHPENN